MTIQKKFILLPLIIGLLSVLIVSYSMYHIRSIVSDHMEVNHPVLSAVYEMEININEAAAEIYLGGISQDIFKYSKEYFEDAISDYEYYFKIYKSKAQINSNVKNIKKLEEFFLAFVQKGRKVFTLHQEQYKKIIQRREIFNNSIEKYLDESLQPNIDVSDLDGMQKLLAADEIEINMHELISAVRGYLLKNDAFLKDRINDSIDDLHQWILVFKSYNLNVNELQIIKKIEDDIVIVEELSLGIIVLEDEMQKLTYDIEKLHIDFDNLMDDEIQANMMKEFEVEALTINDTLMISATLVVVILVLLMLLLFNSMRPIIKTIKNLVNSTKSFAKNREVQVLDQPNNELGVLGEALQKMMLELNAESKTLDTMVTELKIAKEKAEDVTKAKSSFLANMSHEIRTPMNAILGFVDQLAKHELDDKRQQQFSIVKNSGQTLLNIINDILDFSKIESGKMDIENHPHDIKEIIHETTALFDNNFKDKKIRFESHLSSDIPQYIKTDKVRLKQILFNLLSNALKFTPEKGSIDFNVTYDKDRKSLTFAVVDSGIGIAKENQAKIFNAFDQADDSTTRKFGGTGLGLAICSKFIFLMGGELKVESELGKGSKFYFTIPCEEYIEPVIELSAQKDLEYNNKRLSGNLLIVEDNKTNQMLMSMILDDLMLTYDVANDGIEAIDLYQKSLYDAILMDENMPNMNGIEATKHIRSIELDQDLVRIPIIAVTANALSEDRKRFLHAGMDDYVSKPYSEEDIITVLKKHLK